ncbi:MAG: efflux RND transporter periplasmic adaptor subunit, partial [Planctomycetota bacterium]
AQRAAISALNASLEEVGVSIDKSSIEAPFDGVITRRFHDKGTIVTPGAAVFRLVDDRNLEAWVGLPVEIAGNIEIGSLHSLNVGGVTAGANCMAKINEIDAATRTQTVIFRILADEATGDIPSVVSGQLCEVEIRSRVSASGFWVPDEALTSGVRGLWGVFVAVETDEGWRANRRDVTVVKTDNGRSLCTGALTDGELLITGGLHKITHDQRITFEQSE